MAEQTETSNGRGALIFVGIAIVLIALLVGGIWWLKARNNDIAQAPTQTEKPAEQTPETKPNEAETNKPAEDKPAAPAPAPASQPTAEQPKPASNQTTPAQTTPAPAEVPATGPAENLALLAITLTLLGFGAHRYRQSRNLLRSRALHAA